MKKKYREREIKKKKGRSPSGKHLRKAKFSMFLGVLWGSARLQNAQTAL